jgi:hypothetical protein
MPYKDPAKKKAYMKEYNKHWYQANKEPRKLVEKAVANKRKNRLEKRHWLITRLGGACEGCGEDDIAVLDVHHTDPSLKHNSQKQLTDYAWDDLLGKAHTLQLFCSNCHRKHHAAERSK